MTSIILMQNWMIAETKQVAAKVLVSL